MPATRTRHGRRGANQGRGGSTGGTANRCELTPRDFAKPNPTGDGPRNCRGQAIRRRRRSATQCNVSRQVPACVPCSHRLRCALRLNPLPQDWQRNLYSASSDLPLADARPAVSQAAVPTLSARSLVQAERSSSVWSGVAQPPALIAMGSGSLARATHSTGGANWPAGMASSGGTTFHTATGREAYGPARKGCWGQVPHA